LSLIHGNRRGARQAVIAAGIVACLIAPASVGGSSGSATTSAIPPILGTWKESGGTIRVTQTGPGSFQGVLVSGAYGACPANNGPGSVVWKNLRGSGFSYTGTVPWFNTDNCSSRGDGQSTWTLSSINAGTLTTNDPQGGSTETISFTRVGPPPAEPPKTNCKKNGERVLCPSQVKVVRKVGDHADKTRAAARGFKGASVAKQADKLGKLVDLSTQAGETLATWNQLKLPKTPGQAKAKYDDRDLGRHFRFEKLLGAFNSKIAEVGDKEYSTDTAAAAALDQAAIDTNGLLYTQLRNKDQKAHAYSEAFEDPSLNADLPAKIVIQPYGKSVYTAADECGGACF
jgi:hypothetical protein